MEKNSFHYGSTKDTAGKPQYAGEIVQLLFGQVFLCVDTGNYIKPKLNIKHFQTVSDSLFIQTALVH